MPLWVYLILVTTGVLTVLVFVAVIIGGALALRGQDDEADQ